MISLLPNARFITIRSESSGKDWREKVTLIDESIEGLGYDLAEETVFLFFKEAPGAVLDGKDACLISRPVIGPKKKLPEPFGLLDWVQDSVQRKTLISRDWDQILAECFEAWQDLHRKGQKVGGSFMILVKKRLNPDLNLSLEVLFPEV